VTLEGAPPSPRSAHQGEAAVVPETSDLAEARFAEPAQVILQRRRLRVLRVYRSTRPTTVSKLLTSCQTTVSLRTW
jgi:hypothetical protein